MGIPVWSTWDEKPITSQYTREADIIKRYALKNALSVLDEIMPAQQYVTLPSKKGNEYIIVKDKNVSFTGTNRSGGTWVKYNQFKNTFHDIVRKG